MNSWAFIFGCGAIAYGLIRVSNSLTAMVDYISAVGIPVYHRFSDTVTVEYEKSNDGRNWKVIVSDRHRRRA